MALRVVEPEGRVPPHDLDAERALLAIAIVGESTRPILEHVQIGDFYGADHRHILSAMRQIEVDGLVPDPATLLGRLRAVRPGSDWGTVIAELAGAPGHVSHVPQHAAIVVGKARLRRVIATAQRIAAEGYGAEDADAFLASSLDEMQRASTVQRRTRFEFVQTSEVFAQLPPVQWVCRELCIGPGRPTLVAGYGFSGKTLATQAAVLAVAAGERIWGRFFARQGRVLHLDYEQGRHATGRRYQRLAFASGITEEQVAGNLVTVYFPEVYLTDSTAEEELVKACEGVSLCLIDSFRAACPGVDENASEVRVYLDKLTRVSERTGCAFVVVHHAGKSNPDRDKRETARGSSAIFDACGTVLSLSAKAAYEPVLVEIVKVSASATGKHAEAFHLAIEDVPDDDAHDLQAGLRLEYRTEEQVNPPRSVSEAITDVEKDVLAILEGSSARAALQGGKWSGMSGNEIRDLYRGKDRKLVAHALQSLADAGKVEAHKRSGRGGGTAWILVVAESEGEL